MGHLAFAEENGFERVVKDAHEVITQLHVPYANVPLILLAIVWVLHY